jgi:HK97 gp10 family phage protein
MAKNAVTIRGMEKLRAQMGALPHHVDSAARHTVQTETSDVAEDMRRNAPVLSGELKAGIQAEYDDDKIEGRAVSTARHTTFVVHGTSDTPAQDFMTPAAVRSQARFRRRLKKAIDQEMQEL